MGWVRDIIRTFVITSGDYADYKGVEDFFNTLMAVVCVCCAGMAAGLTMGLLSLDVTKLEIKCRVGTDQEKVDAASVLPIVRRHHLLLVTLLLFNSIANETLPIFLGELVPNYLAILIAVFSILIFGEILPSAFFTGVHQLRTSARLVPFVYCLIAALYPIAYPISLALDRIFGEEEEEGALSRSELEALVLMQQVHTCHPTQPTLKSAEEHMVRFDLVRADSYLPPLETDYGSMNETSTLLSDLERGHLSSDSGPPPEDEERPPSPKPDGLSASEVTLMLGVLNLSKHNVGRAMIPMEKVFMVSSSNRLDDRMFLHSILQSGFSRIPVYFRQNKDRILGYMLVKELILSEKDVVLEDFKLREPLFVKPTVGLLEMLGIFQEGQCHLAVVCADPRTAVQHLRAGKEPPESARVLGLVTLEDVLEKVIQGDITDETDRNGGLDGTHSGVMTTTLVRKMKRAHTAHDLYVDTAAASLDRRRSRSRSRGRSSRNLLALSSVNNEVAGDVRHKERDRLTSPLRSSRAVTPGSSERTGDLPLPESGGSTPLGRGEGDFFSDVVDRHVVVEGEGQSDHDRGSSASPARRGDRAGDGRGGRGGHGDSGSDWEHCGDHESTVEDDAGLRLSIMSAPDLRGVHLNGSQKR